MDVHHRCSSQRLWRLSQYTDLCRRLHNATTRQQGLRVVQKYRDLFPDAPLVGYSKRLWEGGPIGQEKQRHLPVPVEFGGVRSPYQLLLRDDTLAYGQLNSQFQKESQPHRRKQIVLKFLQRFPMERYHHGGYHGHLRKNVQEFLADPTTTDLKYLPMPRNRPDRLISERDYSAYRILNDRYKREGDQQTRKAILQQFHQSFPQDLYKHITVPASELPLPFNITGQQYLQRHGDSDDICPLSSVVLTDPVIASDGFTYHRRALGELHSYQPTPRSPFTREQLDPYLTQNEGVRQRVTRRIRQADARLQRARKSLRQQRDKSSSR